MAWPDAALLVLELGWHSSPCPGSAEEPGRWKVTAGLCLTQELMGVGGASWPAVCLLAPRKPGQGGDAPWYVHKEAETHNTPSPPRALEGARGPDLGRFYPESQWGGSDRTLLDLQGAGLRRSSASLSHCKVPHSLLGSWGSGGGEVA